MKILAINGSPNERSTHFLLKTILDELEKLGAQIELVNLSEYRILPCKGCDFCLKEGRCCQEDDIFKIIRKMEEADAIIIGSPTYFGNVSGLVKNLIDRSRMERMGGFKLKNKIFSPIITSGLRNGGGEYAAMSLIIYALGQGMIPATIAEEPISTGTFVIGVIQGDEGWRSIRKDGIALKSIKLLAKRIYELTKATESLRFQSTS